MLQFVHISMHLSVQNYDYVCSHVFAVGEAWLAAGCKMLEFSSQLGSRLK